ncbi:MAG: hypothetical protein COV31_00545 [Candidatus Yanofskybacteria bacterium CG10_big_fil_rev_8_21_14_0_10_46_23]|uniref:Bacterial spore germination immunoglobulin-like domain-containing protein n=1 Tax=Candidatus Yanofskybacteria bacterium CG10_big_fil_rev_8_21_14_0_10_46_23 TaxID=1975098 RepID=A0A2H0R6D1_9BACT|nr:MAG: hypothetical protein COV31_00545 [Candidatus Yanofskybacteria bacterium CG10_big_fil_rev_8_21_14_0_10_46_23]
MGIMKPILILIIIALLLVGGYFLFWDNRVPGDMGEDLNPPLETEFVILESPREGQTVSSPLRVTGQARGNWFFEASFPLILTNWDGLIIGQGIAMTSANWMTTDFVPFEGTINFQSPYKEGDPDFFKRGTLILQKDNPSGLPEFDDAVEITIEFEG